MSKIMVAGIGGVGGYISSLLAHYYDDVTLVARKERYHSLIKHGLILDSKTSGLIKTHPHVVETPKEAGLQDYIFICVKNYSLKQVLSDIKPCLKDSTIVIPVLNGIDHGSICEALLEKGKVVDSLIYIASYCKKDYSIKQVGDFAFLYVGGPHEEENQQVCDLLNDASIDCALCDDIEKELWRKFILSCATNLLTAYYDCTNNEILLSKVRCQEFKDLLKEAYSVAKRKGVDLGDNTVDQLYDHFLYDHYENYTCSLARDIQNHHQSELETFGGYLLKEADELGMFIPQTKFFYEELKRKATI